MAWTHTVNGNLWSDTDFGPFNYGRNFPLYLQDLVEENRNRRVLLSGTASDMFTVGTVFNFSGNLPAIVQWWAVGAFVVGIPSADPTKWVICRITAFNGATGNVTMTPVAQATTTAFGSTTTWTFCMSPAVTSVITSATVGAGGTGVTTVAAVNANTIQGELGTRNEEFFDDFVTALYLPPSGVNGAANNGRSPWGFDITAIDVDSFDAAAQFANLIYDPNHPGIFGISVTRIGAFAGMHYGLILNSTQGTIIWPNRVGMTVEALIYIPSLGGSGNDFNFQFGLFGFTGSTDAIQFNYDSTANKTVLTAQANNAGSLTVGASTTIASGTWYRLTIKSVAGGGAQLFINGVLKHTFTSGQVPASTSAHGMYARMTITKSSGVTKRSVLMDYFYFRNSATR